MPRPAFKGHAEKSGTLGADPVVDLSGLGLANNDYLIAVARGGGAVAADGSWTTLPGSLGANQPLFGRKWVTGDPTSFTFVTTGAVNSVVGIGVWSGVHTTSPVDDSDGVVGTGAMVCPSVDSLGTDRTLVNMAVKLQNTTFTFSGGGELWDALSSTQNFVAAGADEALGFTSSGSRTATPAGGASNGVAYLVVLRPAVSVYTQALTAVMDGTPTMIRRVGKILSKAMDGNPFLTKVFSAKRTLTAVMDGTPTLTKRPAKTLAAVMDGTPTMIRRAAKSMLAVMDGTPSLVRRVAKALVAVMDGTPTLNRGITAHRTLPATMDGTPAMTRRAGTTLVAVMDGTATMTRRVGKALMAVLDGTPRITRRVAKFLSAVMDGTPTVGHAAQRHGTLAVVMGGTTTITSRLTLAKSMMAVLNGTGTLGTHSVLSRILSAVMKGTPRGFVNFPWDSIPDTCPPDWSPNDGLKSIAGDVFFHEPPNEGDPVVGAEVTLIRDSDGLRVSTILTDATGHYSFPRDTNDPFTYHVEVRYADGGGDQQGLSEGGCVPS